MKRWRRVTLLLSGLLWLLLALVGCDTLLDASPRATATASPLPPRSPPIPTMRILSSDELYRNDPATVGRTDPRFASLPVDAVLPPVAIADSPRRVKVVLGDGLILSGERFGFGLPRRPGILLLGEDMRVWGSLPKRLSEAGLVVLALETGQWLEARQVETLLHSLSAIDIVDGGRLAIIGEAQTADLALLACAVNELCDAAALLSPLSRDTLLNMLPSYGSRPLWLAAGKSDTEAYAAALALSRAAEGGTQFHELPAGRGVELLQSNPDLARQLVEWCRSHLAG